MEKAANGTDFDKAKAISTQEPSLFWLALDIVGAIADITVAAKAFGSLTKAAHEALVAGDDTAKVALKALEDQANQSAPDLGRTVREAAEKERERIKMYHGTDQKGMEGIGAVGRGDINPAHSPGGRQDLGQGFYLTLDRETAEAYAKGAEASPLNAG